MKKFFAFAVLSLAVITAFVYYGLNSFDYQNRRPDPPSRPSVKTVKQFTCAPVVIASWNIQVLGQTKMEKPEVVRVIVDILSQYDLIAVQEIRSIEQDVLPRLVEQLNQASGREYSYIISERLGRTSSKEQFAYIYDEARFVPDHDFIKVVSDPNDNFHRPPFAVRFLCNTSGHLPGCVHPKPYVPFSFILANLHSDPDEAFEEAEDLAGVFKQLQDNGIKEDDIILLGDFNIEAAKMIALSSILNMTWVVNNEEKTNVTLTKQYDNIGFNIIKTSEYTNTGGVDYFVKTYDLTLADAKKISDHLPVWAQFRGCEQP